MDLPSQRQDREPIRPRVSLAAGCSLTDMAPESNGRNLVMMADNLGYGEVGRYGGEICAGLRGRRIENWCN